MAYLCSPSTATCATAGMPLKITPQRQFFLSDTMGVVAGAQEHVRTNTGLGNKTVSGVVKTSAGAAYTGVATVVLFDAVTNVPLSVTSSSAADGTYSFSRPITDTRTYFVVAYDDVSGTPMAATSPRNVTAS